VLRRHADDGWQEPRAPARKGVRLLERHDRPVVRRAVVPDEVAEEVVARVVERGKPESGRLDSERPEELRRVRVDLEE
jgi:hypothetical protein